MKQAASFRARPQVFEGLLTERAGIQGNDLDAFEQLHERARRHWQAATMRQVHREKREGERRDVAPEARQGELTLGDGRAEAPPKPVPAPPRPDWRALYRNLQRDWNALLARSQDPDLPLLLMQGYDTLIGRVRALADHRDAAQQRGGVACGREAAHGGARRPQERCTQSAHWPHRL